MKQEDTTNDTTETKDLTVICASDLHGQIELLDPTGADICVIAGDIAPLKGLNQWDKRKQDRWMRETFLGFISRHDHTEFVFIAGNHDFWGITWNPEASYLPKNAHFLRDSGCTVRGLRFWGSPWVPYIGSARRWAFETSEEIMEERFLEAPNDLDILVTHTPPKGEAGGEYIDSCGTYLDGSRTHFGSSALRWALNRRKPKHLVCGHIHTGDHADTRICETNCHNVSLLDEGYRSAFAPLKIYFKIPR